MDYSYTYFEYKKWRLKTIAINSLHSIKDYSFTPPAATPSTMNLDSKIYTIISGNIAINTPE